MVKIWFNDIDWTDKDGNVIPMSYGQEMIVGGSLVSRYQTPYITSDTWGGRTFPVQITVFEGYKLKFAVKNLSVHNLAKLQSCKRIWVHDFDTNEMITVDTETDGLILIETSGNQGTVEQSITFNFSSKRTPAYPGLPRLNTNRLQIIFDSVEYNFYTDKTILSFTNDPELSTYGYNNGIQLVAKSTIRTGKRMMFYLMESDAVQLKELIGKTQPEGIIINPVGPGRTYVTEMGTCQITELTEGLYKCEVTLPTNNIVEYA